MRMTWIRRLALALALALVASGVSAQTLSGTISGRIVDQQGGALPAEDRVELIVLFGLPHLKLSACAKACVFRIFS